MFDISTYTQLLQTGRVGRRFWYYRSLESTNRHVQEIPGWRLFDGMVCLTDHQTEGKGQFGRPWFSSPDENLTFTIVLKPRNNHALQLYSLALMLALNETVRRLTPCKSIIKWPNDLMVSGKKLAGLLTECRYNGKNLDRVAFGLGMNVNQTRFSDDIREHATSLQLEAGGQPIDRAILLATFLNRLESCFSGASDGDLELIREINRNIQGYGQWISVEVDGVQEETPVKILGINEFGYLMVLTANDDIKTYTHQQVRIGTGEP